jgi:hypothetical protein
MEGDDAVPALRLWRALARRCVGPYREHAAAPLTLAGWVAWSTGDDLEAREALAMALGADPDYLFARLLHQACNEGLDPESIRRCLRAERVGRAGAAEVGEVAGVVGVAGAGEAAGVAGGAGAGGTTGSRGAAAGVGDVTGAARAAGVGEMTGAGRAAAAAELAGAGGMAGVGGAPAAAGAAVVADVTRAGGELGGAESDTGSLPQGAGDSGDVPAVEASPPASRRRRRTRTAEGVEGRPRLSGADGRRSGTDGSRPRTPAQGTARPGSTRSRTSGKGGSQRYDTCSEAPQPGSNGIEGDG